jgi:hypothetical protein
VAKRKDKSAVEIQRLLEERRRIEQWLHKLAMAADKTPEAVRERVRTDYEGRLAGVVSELQGYGDELRESLAAQRTRRGDFKDQEREATEELAESELRHAVGEFDESEWGDKKSSILERLITIREGLADAEEEIAELDEVMGALEAPSILEPTEPEEPEPPRPSEAGKKRDSARESSRVSLGAELGLRDLGMGHDPAPARAASAPKSGAGRSERESFGDELAFLKAVADEKQPAPPRRRASGPVKGPDVEKLADQQMVGQSRPSTVNQRTLKCGECGAMNLPTEWYCDRCGAELAAL